ncbi:acetyl-CoA carboxylase biotin carboxyl carrier protein subunit [Kibdelosporangium aridum]|uniref:Acetyl-CoA carboxylase biotin carboxyl carrier protein subunit n=1 Tax=Kibdelosporangium aridum TaxID=2030 RepID=A0A428YX31_KIBAR|nr:acyl-CoA carboxylase subunit epsilon [Kibdelosporangium aridum]RSM74564.1 acetyl-CoA carboxylase biotin carboxyl carrier protein subunit [Kibdelosporangium aridum]
MSDGERPLLRIVRGTPDDIELAALTAVVASLPGRGPDEEPSPESGRRSEWSNPANSLRAPLRPGPGAWRASGFPR